MRAPMSRFPAATVASCPPGIEQPEAQRCHLADMVTGSITASVTGNAGERS
jgi:hypothetical protein